MNDLNQSFAAVFKSARPIIGVPDASFEIPGPCRQRLCAFLRLFNPVCQLIDTAGVNLHSVRKFLHPACQRFALAVKLADSCSQRLRTVRKLFRPVSGFLRSRRKLLRPVSGFLRSRRKLL